MTDGRWRAPRRAPASLLDLSYEELKGLMAELGEPAYRAGQLQTKAARAELALETAV